MPSIAETFQQAIRNYETGNFAQAAAQCQEVIAAEPRHPAAHHLLGILMNASGQPQMAIALIRRSIELDPTNDDCYFNLGTILQGQGQADEAIACYRETVRRHPGHALAFTNLGSMLRSRGQAGEAESCFRKALAINPRLAEAHYNLGNTLKEQGRLADAEECLRRALAANPNDADAHNNLGLVLKDLRKTAEALECYRAVLRLNPMHADAYNNLGYSLEDMGKVAEAAACYREALKLKPNQADYHHNLSNVVARLGHASEAREHNARALALNPAHATAQWNRALLKLQSGEFEEGWKAYELRWSRPGVVPRAFPQPRWDGSNFAGKTILITIEQGMGDMIQFARYVPLVKERGGTVIVECHPPLIRVLNSVRGVDQVVPGGSPLPPLDLQIPMLSLPGIFRSTVTTLPAEVPYLRADEGLVEVWRSELAGVPGLKVGIAWQGNASYPLDRDRSFPLKHFQTLAQVPGVSLISLQVGPGAKQLPGAGFPIIDIGSKFNPASLEDLAAALMSVDLVISSETSVPHLAGALGVPVWMLITLSPDCWRWLLDRDDTPWYPTMRLFRQRAHGEWTEVFERVREALVARAAPKQ